MAETISYKFHGDTVAGRKLILYAKKQHGILKADMGFRGLEIASRRMKFSSGEDILVTSVHGAVEITIFAPVEPQRREKVIEVTTTTYESVVIFSRVIRNDYTQAPSSWACKVNTTPEGENYRLYNEKLYDSQGGEILWKSAVREGGAIDLVSIQGCVFGSGTHRAIADTGARVYDTCFLNHFVYVNGKSYYINPNDPNFSIGNSPGILGACLRVVDGVKYLIVIMCNADSNDEFYQSNWQWESGTYNKETNYESKIYYCPINTLDDLVEQWYDAQTNPNGWRCAGFVEHPEMFDGPIGWLDTGLNRYYVPTGIYHFNSTGDKAVSWHSGYQGQEIVFTPNAWLFEVKLINLAHPMRYVPTRTTTVVAGHVSSGYTRDDEEEAYPGSGWFDQTAAAKCWAVGYHNDVLTGLYTQKVNVGTYARDSDGDLSKYSATETNSMFFASAKGMITKVAKEHINQHLNYEEATYSQGLFSGVPDASHSYAFNPEAGVDAFTPHSDNQGSFGMNVVGIHWVDVAALACSFCLVKRDTNDAVAGLFASINGTVKYGYTTRYSGRTDKYTPLVIVGSNNDYNIAADDGYWRNVAGCTVLPTEQLHESVRVANHSFVAIGEDLLVGNMNAGVSLNPDIHAGDPYESKKTTQRLINYASTTYQREHSGIFPRSLEKRFMDWEDSRNYNPREDIYDFVYPTTIRVSTLVEEHNSEELFTGEAI